MFTSYQIEGNILLCMKNNCRRLGLPVCEYARYQLKGKTVSAGGENEIEPLRIQNQWNAKEPKTVDLTSWLCWRGLFITY